MAKIFKGGKKKIEGSGPSVMLVGSSSTKAKMRRRKMAKIAARKARQSKRSLRTGN